VVWESSYNRRDIVMFVDFTGSNSHNDHTPIRAKIRNFPSHATVLSSLPIDENIKLRMLAQFVIESFSPGSLPILEIEIVGHADTDAQRGHAFEQTISEQRARLVAARLQRDTWTQDLSPPNALIPRPSRIRWSVRGVGSKEPDDENVKRGKNASNMSEHDRRLNRRVEIFLRPGAVPVPFDQLMRDVIDWFVHSKPPWHPPMTIPPGPPQPNWFGPGPPLKRPMTVDQRRAFRKMLKEALQRKAGPNWTLNFDPSPLYDMLKEFFLPDNPQGDWRDSFSRALDEEGQRERNKERPRDEEDYDDDSE
jgi:hypothetical protein